MSASPESRDLEQPSPKPENDDSTSEPPPAKKVKSDSPASTPRSPELTKLWKAVDEDPTDFTAWTYLLQHVDTHGAVHEGREAYDAFLYRYPYCYGYWKKYADFEKKKGTKDRCMNVFERGIQAIPLSSDLWIHYLTHVKAEFKGDPEFVRTQYERAVAACGREWRSDKLWDSYVKWEASGATNPRNVLELYDRIVRNPTQGLSHQFEMFRDFVKSMKPGDILEPSEFASLRQEVLDDASAAKKKKNDKENEDGVEKEESEPEPVVLSEEEETNLLRDRIISTRKKEFKATESKVSARWKFEDAIKRPYFHMKPLEKGQLKNWTEFLEFEIAEQKKDDGDVEIVRILFERCLIACALYEEYWFKYIDWLTSRKDADVTSAIRDVYKRAISHHLPTKVEIHLRYAGFEEESGDFDRASEILKKIQAAHPDMLSLQLRRINLERRRGNITEVHALYNSCIQKAEKELKSDLIVKYVRFLRLHQRDTKMAKKQLEDGLLEDETNPKLHLQLLDIALHETPLNEQAVLSYFDSAIAKSTTANSRLLFAQRKMDFLEDFGSSVSHLLKAQEKYKEIAAEARALAIKEAEKAAEKESEAGDGKGSYKPMNGSVPPSGTASYPPTGAPPSYAGQQNQYQQYGSQAYNSSYTNYGSGGAYSGYGGQNYSGYGSGRY